LPLAFSSSSLSLSKLVEEKTAEVTRLHDYASSLNTAIISEKEKGLNLQGEVERLRVVEMELNRENERLMERVGGGKGVMREVSRSGCLPVLPFRS